jgi:hypothetical protein
MRQVSRRVNRNGSREDAAGIECNSFQVDHAHAAGIRACATLMVSSAATAASPAESSLSSASSVSPDSIKCGLASKNEYSPETLPFAAQIDRMNEGHLRLNKANLPERAGQIETEGVVDSAEPLVACEQRSEAHVAVAGTENNPVMSASKQITSPPGLVIAASAPLRRARKSDCGGPGEPVRPTAVILTRATSAALPPVRRWAGPASSTAAQRQPAAWQAAAGQAGGFLPGVPLGCLGMRGHDQSQRRTCLTTTSPPRCSRISTSRQAPPR